MKPVLYRLLEGEPNALRKRSTVREYLQARILQALQDSGAFAHWAFLGGTALRFLFDLPRYSEDLNFSLVDAAPSAFDKHIDRVVRDLTREAYEVSAKTRGDGAVRSAFVRFGPAIRHHQSPPLRPRIVVRGEIARDFGSKLHEGSRLVRSGVVSFRPNLATAEL